MSETLNHLHVSLVQSNIIWEDVKGNLNKLSSMINKIEKESNLIILPEMFTSGFTMQGKEKVANYAKHTLEWMQRHADNKKAHILGSIIVKEKNKFFNRLYVAAPNGQYQYYDKRHLFRIGQEHLHFEHGNKSLIFKIGKFVITC